MRGTLATPEKRKEIRADGWRIALTFGAAALLYLDPVPQSMALNMLDLATSLVDHGSVGLDEYRGVDTAVRDGRILSGMPPGASFLAALVYAALRPLLGFVRAADRLVALYAACTLLIAIPASALTLVLVYRCTRTWEAPRRDALLTAALLGFGTMHFGYATGFYKKSLAATCLVLAFTRVTAAPAGRPVPPGLAALAGVLSGLAAGLDYPALVGSLPLVGYLLSRRPGLSSALAFAGGAAAALLPVLAYHAAAFGSVWRTAYQFRLDPGGNILGAPNPGSLMFLVLTLLASSPCLVWSLRGWLRAMRDGRHRPEMVTLALIVGALLFLVSGWSSIYPHEASFASRLLLPALPFLALPMAFGLPGDLRGVPGLTMAWSIGATLLAAQASMIPSGTIPPWYALKVLATSWGTGPLFSQTLAAWLGLPNLHRLASGGLAPVDWLRAENRSRLVAAVAGQAVVKLVSLAATAAAAAVLWRHVWRSAPSLGRPK